MHLFEAATYWVVYSIYILSSYASLQLKQMFIKLAAC